MFHPETQHYLWENDPFGAGGSAAVLASDSTAVVLLGQVL